MPKKKPIVHYVPPARLEANVGGTRTACGRSADGVSWSPRRSDAICQQCRKV